MALDDETVPLFARRPRKRRWVLLGVGAMAATSTFVGRRRRTASFHVVPEAKGAFDISACADYDDDQVYPFNRPDGPYRVKKLHSTSCVEDDFLSYCEADAVPKIGVATHYPIAASLCASACGDENTSFFMPCVWQAVSRLDDVCAGTFNASFPARSNNMEQLDDTTMQRDDDEPYNEVDLYPCDEHAVCSACAPANENCLAVAAHYGTLRDPTVAFRRPMNRSGASIALWVLDYDLGFWCAHLGVPLTLSF